MEKEKEVKDYTPFCESKNCPEFIRWSFGEGECTSCKLVGQSYHVDNVPEDCLFKDEIKDFNN